VNEITAAQAEPGEIEFDVSMDWHILFDYYLYHTYRSFTGILGTVVGILLIAGFFYNTSNRIISLIFGIIVLLYLPVNLSMSARRQMLLVESYKSPLHYRLGSEGITISQGEVTQSHEWSAVIKAAGSAKSIFLYTGKNNATIFPRSAMGKKTEAVLRMISRYVAPGKVKIRF
jgi:hypothetical protein